MLENMAKFTNEQVRHLEDLERNGFDGATTEDILLYGQWKAAVALDNENFKREYETLQAESARRIEIAEKEAETSANALDEVVKAIKAKYKDGN